jgi:probable HAF family extracellular repeat protein
MWTNETRVVEIGKLANDTYSGATDVSGNGAVVIGQSGTNMHDQAFRWTAADGMEGLGYLPNLGPVPGEFSGSRAWGVSFDGSVVVGQTGRFEGWRTRGFVWDEGHGMRDLQHVLRDEHGLAIRGSLESAWAISDNRSILIGTSRSPERAWVVYLDKPIDSWSETAGDFNGDGQRDAADLDLLSAQVRDQGTDLSFDLFEDRQITDRDRASWVKYMKHTWFGDANLDGQFNSNDLVQALQAGKYEVDEAAGWAEGDWNGDGAFKSSDFVLALADGGYEKGPRMTAAMSAVPEPASCAMLLAGLLGLTKLPQRSQGTQRRRRGY